MEFLYHFVKNVCVFTLVATLLLNVFPDARYKKYIKLFAGILLIALVFHPIVQWKHKKMDVEALVARYAGGLTEVEWQLDTGELEQKIYERASAQAVGESE